MLYYIITLKNIGARKIKTASPHMLHSMLNQWLHIYNSGDPRHKTRATKITEVMEDTYSQLNIPTL